GRIVAIPNRRTLFILTSQRLNDAAVHGPFSRCFQTEVPCCPLRHGGADFTLACRSRDWASAVRLARASAPLPASCPDAPAAAPRGPARGGGFRDWESRSGSPGAARWGRPASPAEAGGGRPASQRALAVLADVGPRVGDGGGRHLHIGDDGTRRIPELGIVRR